MLMDVWVDFIIGVAMCLYVILVVLILIIVVPWTHASVLWEAMSGRQDRLAIKGSWVLSAIMVIVVMQVMVLWVILLVYVMMTDVFAVKILVQPLPRAKLKLLIFTLRHELVAFCSC